MESVWKFAREEEAVLDQLKAVQPFVDAFDRVDRQDWQFHPQFNAIFWAADVFDLMRQIKFAHSWMRAWAKTYRRAVRRPTQPSHAHFQTAFFADDCLTRIESCRYKLALLVWSFHKPLNPEERVLDFRSVLAAMPCKTDFPVSSQESKLLKAALETLTGPSFTFAERYRHVKIHRREPRVEIYGRQPHHDPVYVIPVSQERLRELKEEIRQKYPPEADSQAGSTYRRVLGDHRIGKDYYERRQIKDHIWNYVEVNRNSKTCFVKLLLAGTQCFRVLADHDWSADSVHERAHS